MSVVVFGLGLCPNKKMVLTLPARGSFEICARYYGLGSLKRPTSGQSAGGPHILGVSHLSSDIYAMVCGNMLTRATIQR
jgi:hypothetical protein